MSEVAKVMAALATLNRVRESLEFLAAQGIVRQEAVASGCRIFVKKNPCINEYLASRAASAAGETGATP